MILVSPLILTACNSVSSSNPWWNGTKLVNLCAVGVTSNSYGCYQAAVKSNGKEIISIDLPIAGEGYFPTFGTVCGKLDVRYCDFHDQKNREWEVKQL